MRDRARSLLLMTGNGRQPIGEPDWVWEALRPISRTGSDLHDRHLAVLAAY